MNTTTDILDLLTAQHDEVDALIVQIDESTERRAKAALFGEMADKLAAHMTLEEELFYPAIVSVRTEEMLREATEEHLSIRRVLADLLSMDPMDAQFDAKLEVMSEQISHHAHEEEEQELFPLIRKSMSEAERGALGAEFLSRFESLLVTEPRTSVPAETEHATPLETA